MAKAKSQDTTKPAKAYVAYFRVSTDRQERSGLGLEAQRSAVLDFINGNGDKLIAEYTEIESGKRNDRPELQRAISHAKKEKAVLTIAKMDRLGRRASYVLNLLDNSGVRFVFVENPNATDLEIGIRAVVAQEEGRLISQRTKDALAAAKARGVKLGSPNPAKGSKAGAAAQRVKADQFAANVTPVIREIEASGVKSHLGLARALNARGIPTARGGDWYAATVRNVLRRA